MAPETKFRLLSADSHVVEPRDLWVERLESRFTDRAPRVESHEDGDYFVVPNTNVRPKAVGFEGAMIDDKASGSIERPAGYRYEQQRPGAFDAVARLEDQALEGVESEIVYPGWLLLYEIDDFELKAACLRVYNDWLLDDFCAATPGRVLGICPLPVGGPIEEAVAEARRVAEKGAPGVMLPQTVPGMPYNLPYYDPLWDVLEELGLPVSFHQAAGCHAHIDDMKQRGGFWANAIGNKTTLGQIAVQLLFGGVAEAHPDLRIVLVEGGIGWVAFLLNTMDHLYEDHHRWIDPPMHSKPSELFWRQFWVTFEDDRPGLLTLPMLDERRIMWGSDYPHTEGVFPFSQQQIEEDFEGLPESTRQAITFDNVAALYDIPVSGKS